MSCEPVFAFLLQLKALKTTDNKSTLLHFVAGTVERKFPQVLEFAEDLSFTMAAARGNCMAVEKRFLSSSRDFFFGSFW